MSEIAIKIDDLTHDFGKVRTIDHLSLQVPAGIIFGFLGPNGAGKTTTIHLLLGLLQASSGRIEVLGFDSRTQADQIRAHTGALLEHPGIYEQMSAEDNLEFYGRIHRLPAAERRSRIQELLSQLALWDRRRDRAGTWSRGMKQKLALARALLHRPRLVLLDEPTAGLDLPSATTVRDDLVSLAAREGVTFLLTTHNIAEAEKVCSQLAVIRRGKLVAQGGPGELRARTGHPRLEVLGRGASEGILRQLAADPRVSSVEAQNDRLIIDLIEEAETTDLVSLLVEAGFQVEEVHRGMTSLEEVLMHLMAEPNSGDEQ